MKRSIIDFIIYLLSYKYQKKGFSELAATAMIRTRLYENHKGGYSRKIRRIAKKHGFLPSTVLAIGINEDNYEDYLSDEDHYRLIPFDGEYHSWVENKLTIKYLLGDLASCMPQYYYQIASDGRILKLFECPNQFEASISGITDLLFDIKKAAIKPEIGRFGHGFYKATYNEEGQIHVNDVLYTKDDFIKFLKSLKGYLITEYLESSGLPAEIYPKTVNSIRVLIGVEDGKQYNIGNFIKFGQNESGYVDNLSGGGITCPVNEQGYFHGGYTKVKGVLVTIDEHPDTHKQLAGQLEQWSEIIHLARQIFARLPQLTYCGFDFVISDKGIKLLEINDKNGLYTIQIHHPLMKDKDDNFYMKRLIKLKCNK